jgi:RNA polymerase sigma-70 factor (ECF subfamily)
MRGEIVRPRGYGIRPNAHPIVRSPKKERRSRGGFPEKRGVEFFPFDAEYLRRLRLHEAATEEHFADYFGIRLMKTLRKRGVSRQAAEDVIQDTFVRVLNAVHSPEGVRQPNSFGAFVFGTTRNLLSEHRRREGRNTPLSDIDVELLEFEWDIEYELICRENAFRAQQVLKELSEKDPKAASLLKASFMDETAKDQICAELGVTRDYLRVLQLRAREKFLRRYLKKYDEQNKPKNHDDEDE